jgi:hypothetical protein
VAGDDGLSIGERRDGIVRSEPILRSARRPDGVNALRARLARRRENIVAEIERNRRGDYKVPTWVLALGLLALVGAIAAFVAFG